ncbi:MAG: VOC family protein [bacterium]
MVGGKIMEEFSPPAGTHIGHVHLQISDLPKALEFYAGLLGFREVKREGATACLSATGGPPYHIILTERPGAKPKPRHTTGLYHVAVRYPGRRDLARAYRQLASHACPVPGMSHH